LVRKFLLVRLLVLSAASFVSWPGSAQERPYFITYSHQMEEPDHLEISINPIYGTQRGGNAFLGSSVELEYGIKGWWTKEFYLDGQSTLGDSTVFTCFRWENRFRPLMREHWINPVLYVEFENLNGADKTLLEVVGHDREADHAIANSAARRERLHEMETKLILSSNFRGWNVSENFIAEKNLNDQPWEFGYAAGVSRPLALAAVPEPCRFCRENFTAGVELYGGAGTAHQFGFSGTSHYLAPLLSWQLPSDTTFRIAPTWGLTHSSHRFLLRFGVSFELKGIRRWFR
jgi:hypothetical protein